MAVVVTNALFSPMVAARLRCTYPRQKYSSAGPIKTSSRRAMAHGGSPCFIP